MAVPNVGPPSPGRLRVLLASPTLDTIPGGVAVVAQRLTDGLNQIPGISIDLVPITPRLPRGLRGLQRIPVVRTLVTAVVYWSKLLVRMPGADVAHVNSAKFSSFMISSLPAIAIAKLFRRPVLLNYHNGDLEADLRRFPIFRRLLRLADRIVVPSGFLASVFRDAGFEPIVVPNHVDVERFPFRERSPLRPVCLSCRHFEDLYDIPTLVEAFAEVQAVYPDAVLRLAGKGSRQGAIETLVRKLGLRRVEFLGQIDSAAMALTYRDADLLLNASRVDNAPSSIIEALVSGLPIVSTNAGGIPFLVQSGESGRLVPVGNPRAMAKAVLEALANPDLTRAMAAKGAAVGRPLYAWSSVRDRWIDLYRSVARS